ncbi:hypothetical protein PNOK_0953700 [Pyrrhoderma noxium]|uniref:Uncharacterized protein n=1 Tax=Pyrrhoderma noxium TaxID=2282107 RepID=A0A286U610_9AGAM|nr:hypothetical protein PNOK_0953700 [Pyrrhoderma noxium]
MLVHIPFNRLTVLFIGLTVRQHDKKWEAYSRSELSISIYPPIEGCNPCSSSNLVHGPYLIPSPTVS